MVKFDSDFQKLKYRFLHQIIQSTTYELISYADRKYWHLKVANFYESKFHEDKKSEMYPLLAHHWKESSNFEKAR